MRESILCHLRIGRRTTRASLRDSALADVNAYGRTKTTPADTIWSGFFKGPTLSAAARLDYARAARRLPIRLVRLHDTSVAMIEWHYSRHITEGLDELVVRAVVPIVSLAT